MRRETAGFSLCAPPPYPPRNSTLQHVPSTAHPTKLHTTTATNDHFVTTINAQYYLIHTFSLHASGVARVPEQKSPKPHSRTPISVRRKSQAANPKHMYTYFRGVASADHPTVKTKNQVIDSCRLFLSGLAVPNYRPPHTSRSPYTQARIKARNTFGTARQSISLALLHS